MRAENRAGLEIAWQAFGEGSRQAVAVHCALGRGRMWQPVAEALRGVQLLAFDMPGHGRSRAWDPSDGDYLSRTADVVLSFCEGPTDLVGHSFGAVAALAAAVRRPRLVRSLTLIEPVLFAAASGTPEHAAHREAFAPFTAATEAGDPAAAARAFHGIWGGADAFDALPAQAQADMVSRIHLIAAQGPGLNDDTAGILASGALEQIAAPVLFIAGRTSPPVIGAIHAALARRTRSARQILVDGAGHMAPLTHPGAVARAIDTQFA